MFKGGSTPEKTFPARATLKNLDDRLRPGMSATAEIIIERQPEHAADSDPRQLRQGRQAGGVRPDRQGFQVRRRFEVGKRTMKTVIVTGGLKEGEIVTLESPAEAAKKAKKKL